MTKKEMANAIDRRLLVRRTRSDGETMTIPQMTVLVVGATGSIGRLVVDLWH